MAITKSALLGRLLYLNEELRTTKCPEHTGTWRGLDWHINEGCSLGCDLTGWLPNNIKTQEDADKMFLQRRDDKVKHYKSIPIHWKPIDIKALEDMTVEELREGKDP